MYSPQNDTTEAPLDHNGSITNDPVTKASLLNSHFARMNSVNSPDDPLPQTAGVNQLAPGLSSMSYTLEEVEKAISEVKVNSATSYDGISNRALLMTKSSISVQLTRIINECLDRGYMPTPWKKANVCPIHKNGSTSNVKNYRPISLLSCVSKVLERLVCNTLKNYLEDNKLITPSQYGFRHGSSTLDQLIDVYHKMMEGLDSRQVTKLLFLDVSKAFDKVWHKGLLHKMENLGIHGLALGFFTSYLSNRSQRVVIKGATSTWLDLKAGVPQGSLLGPILFLIFSNDLVNDIETEVKLFADDTILGVTEITARQCALKMQPDVDRILQWAKKWKVTLNALKTKCLTISRKRSEFAPLVLDGRVVEEVSTHCHLGLRLQNSGKWRIQIDHMKSKASQRISILKYYSRRFERKPLLQLYLSYVRPILEYGD